MARAWYEVYVEERDKTPLRLPVEVCEYPGGWLCWLNSIGIKKTAWDLKNDDDDDEEVEEEVSELVVVNVPRRLRSDSRHDYTPDDLPDVLKGTIKPERTLPVDWQAPEQWRRDPDDLDEILDEFSDLEEEEEEEEEEEPVDEQEVANAEDVSVPPYQQLIANALLGRLVEVIDIDHELHGSIGTAQAWKHENIDDIEVDFGEALLDGWGNRLHPLKLWQIQVAPADSTIGLIKSGRVVPKPAAPPVFQPPADPAQEPIEISSALLEKPEAAVAPTVDEVAEQRAKGIKKLEKANADFERWQREDLPWLNELIEQGYDPKTHRAFKELTAAQRKLLSPSKR